MHRAAVQLSQVFVVVTENVCSHAHAFKMKYKFVEEIMF